MALGVGHGADPRQGQEGLQATVGAQHDVRVQTVSDHQATLPFDAELRGHAVEHEVVWFAHRLGLTLGCRLHGLQQAART